MATQVSADSFGQSGMFLLPSEGGVSSQGQVLLQETPMLRASDLDAHQMGLHTRSAVLTKLALSNQEVYQEILKRHPIAGKFVMMWDAETQQDLSKLCASLPSFASDTIIRVFVAIVRVNLNFSDDEGRVYSGYYPQLSYVNHSCVPNCQLRRENATLSLVSLCPIAPNEQLFIAYSQTEPPLEELDLSERQLLLFQQHFFRCQCRLCVQQQKEKNERLALM